MQCSIILLLSAMVTVRETAREEEGTQYLQVLIN